MNAGSAFLSISPSLRKSLLCPCFCVLNLIISWALLHQLSSFCPLWNISLSTASCTLYHKNQTSVCYFNQQSNVTEPSFFLVPLASIHSSQVDKLHDGIVTLLRFPVSSIPLALILGHSSWSFLTKPWRSCFRGSFEASCHLSFVGVLCFDQS